MSDLFPAQSGHFLFESGHHGDLWLELDALWARPTQLAPSVTALARELARHQPDAICGPQTGGAYLARLIALELGLKAFATEKNPLPTPDTPAAEHGLYRTTYSLPFADRRAVRQQRIALVDDVINAGSATQASLTELLACGAKPVALGALLVLNEPAAQLALRYQLPLVSLAQRTSHLWEPALCPLCRQGVPLTTPH
ncbi:MAG: phosphoribosyltransferase family protein [Opitutae bacterium]